MADDQERTEAATPKRRREAREEGEVARSPEVLTAFVLGAGLLGLWVGAGNLYRELVALATEVVRYTARPEIGVDEVSTLAMRAAGGLVRGVAPVFLAGILGGVAGNLVQVGFMVSSKALTPNLDRLNPASGLKNLFQLSKLVDLAKNLIKVAAVSWAAYLAMRSRVGDLPALAGLSPRGILVYELEAGFEILRNVLLVYVVIAVADYAFQKWQFEKKLRMSKQEVKDEHKDTEGDPLIKSRIRSLQREMARRRMMAEVPTSDVVITNPTHFAVALKYDPASMAAPEIVAKGADLVARKILELAREHRVPVYEDPPVARALFRGAEVGDPVPVDLFQAVAEILARVYRLSGRATAAGGDSVTRPRPGPDERSKA